MGRRHRMGVGDAPRRDRDARSLPPQERRGRRGNGAWFDTLTTNGHEAPREMFRLRCAPLNMTGPTPLQPSPPRRFGAPSPAIERGERPLGRQPPLARRGMGAHKGRLLHRTGLRGPCLRRNDGGGAEMARGSTGSPRTGTRRPERCFGSAQHDSPRAPPTLTPAALWRALSPCRDLCVTPSHTPDPADSPPS